MFPMLGLGLDDPVGSDVYHLLHELCLAIYLPDAQRRAGSCLPHMRHVCVGELRAQKKKITSR